jgi:ferredoxin-NADP reductase/nitrite reductase/ring-hydroxylating ferredoxin subunit
MPSKEEERGKEGGGEEGYYHKVANINDFKEGRLLRVEPKGAPPIVLAKVDDEGNDVYAIDATCTHEGGPLDEGTLEGHNLTCPWHNAIFDVRNGNVSDQTVWATNLRSYPVRLDKRSGDISIMLRSAAPQAKSETPFQKERGENQQEEGKGTANTTAAPTTNEDAKSKQEKMEASERKYYEEQEKKTPAASKLQLELIEKERIKGTDMMSFKMSRRSSTPANLHSSSSTPSSPQQTAKSQQQLDFAAGQFAFFKLEDVHNDPKTDIRHFSIASSPTENDFILISTRIRSSPYKQKLASLDKGAKILAWGPEGDFVLHDDYSRPAVLLSGGIGVTPFRSMIKFATDKKLPLKVIMFDSNRDESNILYRQEFEEWVKQNRNLKVIYTITGEEAEEGKQQKQNLNGGGNNNNTWKGERGRINKEMITKYLSNDEIAKAIYYICGPPGMLKAMQTLLQDEMQIPKNRVKKEEFTGY